MDASETRTPRRSRRLLLKVGLSITAAVALTAALLPGSGSAVSLVPPNNTAEPSIVGEAVEGRTLTANRGNVVRYDADDVRVPLAALSDRRRRF